MNVHTGGDELRLGAVQVEMAAALQRQPRWVWVPDEALQAAGVTPWSELPLWLPAQGEYAHFMRNSNARARAWGLRTRPVAETAHDILAWWQALPAAQQAFDKAGLEPERERELLAALA